MRKVQVYRNGLFFDARCVACGEPSAGEYAVSRVFMSGRQGMPVGVLAPLCARHLALARAKSPAEVWVGRAGLALGIFAWLVTALGLPVYWRGASQPVNVGAVLLAVFLGAGFFLICWVGAMAWAAPRFASAESKAARNAVALTRYW